MVWRRDRGGGADGGGEGDVARFGGDRWPEDAGSGGGAGGTGADEGGEGDGGGAEVRAALKVLRAETGGGVGLTPGRGEGALDGVTSGDDCADRVENEELGLEAGFGDGSRRFETTGLLGRGEGKPDF